MFLVVDIINQVHMLKVLCVQEILKYDAYQITLVRTKFKWQDSAVIACSEC